MKKAGKLMLGALAVSAATSASAQIPDLLTAFDAGGRAMGMGGGLYGTSSDTLSAINNPAGLSFIDERTFGFVMRNKPRSETIRQGRFTDPIRDTEARFGHYSLTHVGAALPMGTGTSGRGVLGIAYSTGGYIHDEERGNGALTDSGGTYTNWVQKTQAQTDYFTVSYGWPNRGKSTTFGAGVVIASQYVRSENGYTFNPTGGGSTNVPPIVTSGTGWGVGLVAGVQIVPEGNSNISYGFSGRTPIQVGGSSTTKAFYERIPGKLSASVAVRKDNLRGGNDYLVYGAQIDAYLFGQESKVLERKNTIAGGAGLEYNYVTSAARIPVRLGYGIVPSAGSLFKARNALTFGIGYKPFGRSFGLDLNFAAPSTGGTVDAALAVSYRFGK